MATVKDYVRWRGDLPYARHPFNEVDNVIMSSLTYLTLSDIVPSEGNGFVSLADALAAVLGTDADISPHLCAMVGIDAELMRLLAASKRFGAARLRDSVEELSYERALQFAALTIDLTDDLSVVAFRGTDHSLVGWRENFMLGCKVTQAQERAAAYLAHVARRAVREGRQLMVCGHSKGGNLALYAAATCPVELRTRIARVWSNDGPGMAPEVMPTRARDTLGDAYLHIVPEHSVVGMLFYSSADNTKVVRSSASGVLQHDPLTWEVELDHLATADSLATDALMVAETFDAWLDGIGLEARERFVNEAFDALAAGNPDRIDAVMASPAAVQRVFAAALATSPDTKGVARKLAASAASTASGIVASAVGHATEVVTAAAKAAAAEVTEAYREIAR